MGDSKVNAQRQPAGQAQRRRDWKAGREGATGWKTYTARGQRAEVLGVRDAEEGAGDNGDRLHFDV